MKILAIIGSIRKHGSTYNAVSRIEDKLKELDSELDFEYLFLDEKEIRMCKGCSACFNKGEEFCPCKDDIPGIVESMKKADGVIFACPTYVANVSGLMKNFIDRLAYICHRPAFYDKKALLLTTVGISGGAQALAALNLAVSIWGYKVTGKLNIATRTNSVSQVPEGYYARVDNAALRFYNLLKDRSKPSPGIHSLTVFKFRQNLYRKHSASYDAVYWKSKGWLEPGSKYFCDARINPAGSFIARIIAMIVEASAHRGK